MVALAIVASPLRVGRSRKGRMFAAFDVRCSHTGTVLRVTLRGRDAERAAASLIPGMEVRLDGELRTVRYLKVSRVLPAVERWRAATAPRPAVDSSARNS